MPKLGEDGASAPVAIAVRDLRKSFGTHEVLKGVSLTAHEGDVVAIIGGSGSGKSTMLRCINFLETPTAGTIEIGGEAVKMHADGLPSDRRQLERLRQSLGMVFQSFNLWTHKTVLENLIEVPVHVLKCPKDQAVDRAHRLCCTSTRAGQMPHGPPLQAGWGMPTPSLLMPTTGLERVLIVFWWGHPPSWPMPDSLYGEEGAFRSPVGP